MSGNEEVFLDEETKDENLTPNQERYIASIELMHEYSGNLHCYDDVSQD